MIGSHERTAGFARFGRLLLGAIALSSTATRVTAQDTTGVRNGWIVGALAGVPGYGRETFTEALTFGIGATRLVPNHPGADLAFVIVPRFLADGALVANVRAGVGVPLGLTPNLFIIPSAGVSAVGGLASGGGGGVVGLYGGVATVIAAGSVGFKVGGTWHRFGSGTGNGWLLEIGIMHVPLPSPKRASPE